MKSLALLFFIGLFVGCSSIRSIPYTEPIILRRQPLPEIPPQINMRDVKLNAEMLVNENGIVEKAKLLKGIGDRHWDSLAALTLMNWKFSSAMRNNKPIKMLIHRIIKIEIAELQYIFLAEIVLPNFSIADSVYSILKKGGDFYNAAKKYSISASNKNNGIIGRTAIQSFSQNIQDVLSELKEDEFTKPLSYANNFIIFKRLKSNNLNLL